MNKRYIDFVPAQKKKSATTAERSPEVKVAVGVAGAKEVAKKTAVRRAANRAAAVKEAAKRSIPEEIPVEEMFAMKTPPAGVSTGLREPKLGVIEDFQPKFVQAEVKKRPLGAKKTQPAVTQPKVVKTAQKPVKTPIVAKTNFINTGKVEKRPLSGGVHRSGYTSKTASIAAAAAASVEKEKAKGAETIIEKPEKDSKAGLIIAIILTITLGAAAGTVAFLLLPK